MKKVLITGGAGYKGVILIRSLLDAGFSVTCFDNFLYGPDPVLPFASNENFSVIKKDIRNIEKADVQGHDIICHLAGISGYPACEANPHSAQMINVERTKTLVKLLDRDQIVIYASTTSMYGRAGERQDEDSKVNPVSLYGKTKYEAEQICMDRENSISLRFATIFGVGPRMRNDLLLNDFVCKAVHDRNIVLFDEKSVRTFVHVNDAIRSYVLAANNPEPFIGGIFNVGGNSMNYSKLDIANEIKKHVNFEIIKSNLADPDKRDFIINFDKISALGFQPSISLEDGVKELIRLYSWYRPYNVYQTI